MKKLVIFFKKLWVIVFVLVPLESGCAMNGKIDATDEIAGKATVVGFIQLEPRGPFFRAQQGEAKVRFLDVVNTKTDERTRIMVQAKGERFVTHLEPGNYELFRLQIGEGPFRSESHLEMKFEVYADTVTYLGLWRIRLDPPKTVRMVKIDVITEVPEWEAMLESHPDLGPQPLVVSLLQPITHEVRIFPVAPLQPRSKYFYRR